jgi:NarL family two-component system response regulator LiaR
MNTPITILIADDHRMVREGIKTFLRSLQNLKVVGEAEDGVQAVSLAASLRPDVILMDLIMPRLDGIQAIQQIMAHDPQMHVLVVTSFSEDSRVTQAIQAGALGYLLKDSSPQELETAILTVAMGESYIPSQLLPQLLRRLTPPTSSKAESVVNLTGREKEVLKLVGEGRTNEEIGAALCISVWTVRAHVWRVMKKLLLENRTQVALYAVQHPEVCKK